MDVLRTHPIFGAHKVQEDQAAFFRIGPLSLEIQRRRFEWRVLSTRSKDPLESSSEAIVPCAPTVSPGRSVHTVRFGVDGPIEDIVLSPTLPDRAIVCATDPELLVPPDETVTLHVGTPIWIRVDLAEPSEALQARKKLLEVPSVVLSDTWFGPPTASEGEVCYAIRTAGRLHRENLPDRAHIARTEVTIGNRARDHLSVAKLRIPIPVLGLYLSQDLQLRTNRMSLVRRDDRDMAELRVDDQNTEGLGELVATPRSAEENALVRAFSSVLSLGSAAFGGG
ncbi:MAG: hypothetical protein HYV07_25350 [Deltaproteobacteria bacterium]|nr:hypothetical protein [Deltaproteobacteria bacterium]